mmetsp:Transcript_134698/g.430306  ORF Transcript_134698/g.430306 Transcript_134698/m.430306 type:complete len:155 (+) Transcript_134698:242-706(+)
MTRHGSGVRDVFWKFFEVTLSIAMCTAVIVNEVVSPSPDGITLSAGVILNSTTALPFFYKVFTAQMMAKLRAMRGVGSLAIVLVRIISTRFTKEELYVVSPATLPRIFAALANVAIDMPHVVSASISSCLESRLSQPRDLNLHSVSARKRSPKA